MVDNFHILVYFRVRNMVITGKFKKGRKHMGEYEQLECFICCMECGETIFWGDDYYKLGDFVFCQQCLETIAENLLHCQHCVLGQETP